MNNTTRSELSFSPTVEDDGKFMVCRAENPAVSGLFLESTWKISVVCEYSMLLSVPRCHLPRCTRSYLTIYSHRICALVSSSCDAFSYSRGLRRRLLNACFSIPVSRFRDEMSERWKISGKISRCFGEKFSFLHREIKKIFHQISL